MAGKTSRLNMRIAPDRLERLREAATADRRSVAAAVEKAIDFYCEHVEAERAGKEKGRQKAA